MVTSENMVTNEFNGKGATLSVIANDFAMVELRVQGAFSCKGLESTSITGEPVMGISAKSENSYTPM